MGKSHPRCSVPWKSPSLGSVSLNVDGSVFTSSCSTEFGGLIRDHEDYFLHGFYGNIDPSCILHAEILALYHSLDLCWSTNFRRVICYSESLNVIQLVQYPLNMFHKLGNLSQY